MPGHLFAPHHRHQRLRRSRGCRGRRGWVVQRGPPVSALKPLDCLGFILLSLSLRRNDRSSRGSCTFLPLLETNYAEMRESKESQNVRFATLLRLSSGALFEDRVAPTTTTTITTTTILVSLEGTETGGGFRSRCSKRNGRGENRRRASFLARKSDLASCRGHRDARGMRTTASQTTHQAVAAKRLS